MQQENHKLLRAFAMATNALLEPIVQLNYRILVWGLNYKRTVKLKKRVMRIITCVTMY